LEALDMLCQLPHVCSAAQHSAAQCRAPHLAPAQALYLLLVTNKQSNILEDLDTLRLLSKVVPEFSQVRSA
jgi:hypothetical protein